MQIKNFIRTSLLGGLVVILPVAIFILVFRWLFGFVTDLIQPITNLMLDYYTLPEIFADIIVLFTILTICFFVGILVKTRVGNFIHRGLENRILAVAPGYTMIKETVMQFFGQSKSPFSSVALVRVSENDTLMTGFITEYHPNSTYTVFVPFGLNMTAGHIYHLNPDRVFEVDIPVDKAIRSVLSCGAGSAAIMAAYLKEHQPRPIELESDVKRAQ